jgi:hypothetical protein
VGLEWRPELSFFERRSEILRMFEEQDQLEAFHWTATDVTVRSGEFEGATVGMTGATCYVNTPDHTGVVREVVGTFLDELRPKDVVLRQALFYYLLALGTTDPVEAQSTTALRVAGEMAPNATPLDWALLLDGRSDRLKATFQVEYGVVGRQEVALRLGGAGRIAARPSPIPSDSRDAPECALFLAWDWSVDRATAGREEVATVWDSLIEETNLLSEKVLASCQREIEVLHKEERA